MFTSAQPPLTLVAMATKIWEFQHKISSNWDYIRDITEHLAPNWGFTRLGILMVSLKFNPDCPLLPWQRNVENFNTKLLITQLIIIITNVAENNAPVSKQGVFEVGQFNDVIEIYFRWGSKSNKGIPSFTPN